MTRKRNLVKVGNSVDIRLVSADIKDFGLERDKIKEYEADVEEVVIKKKRKIENENKRKA